ncbi:hypothetical protein [Pseudoalteromonas sp. R3]|uniref:hypothetical protein n=1 Tax=Pseudoalteromonas sp. R3 TaxID=1709477 RepID=UPI000B2416CF|nr:hypothetical protein [Pseudoalteromonas sp. R3]AZZ97242.1 hypothetical protein ELR70_08855 [Pseudoalteromonas sp. R3]
MQGFTQGGRKLSLLYALFSMCLLYPLYSSATEGFEQAYVPIQVGKITTFIPIELRPDAIVKLSSQELDGYTSLAWTPSPQAEYYQILKFDGQTWQLVASRVTTSFYRYNGSGSFKVVACHRFGCSSNSQENMNVNEALAVKAFYTQGDNALTAGSFARIGWQLSGATSAVITHTQNGGSQTTSISSTSMGTQSFAVYGDSKFTLTAYGFNGQSTSTSIQVPVIEENPFLAQGAQSDYKQPLFGLNLDIIERTVFQNEHHLIFSTHDGKLYFFRAHKEQEQPVSWQQEWSIELEGVVNSVPRLTENHLYYNETNSDNQGRTCKVRLADTDSLICTTYEDDALLTSPVIINNDGDYSAKFMDSLAGVNQKATGVYAFYQSGKVKIFDQQDLTPEPQSFTLTEHIEQPVINTPTLFLNKKNIQGLTELILVKDQDQVLGVAVPTASSVQQQSRSFGVLSVNALSEPKPMTLLWKGAL